MLDSVYSRFTSALIGIAGLITVSNPCAAMDYSYSFVNTSGINTTLGATVSGRILGVGNGDGVFFNPITVTFDSVSTGFDPGFGVDSWTDFAIVFVTGGNISFIQFNANDGSEAVDLHTSDRGLIYLGNFSAFYRTPGEEIHYAPITTSDRTSTPDSGTTLALLGGAMATLGWFRRRIQAKA